MSAPTNPTPATVVAAAGNALTSTMSWLSRRVLKAVNLQNLLVLVGVGLLVVFGGIKLVSLLASAILPDSPLIMAVVKAATGLIVAIGVIGFLWKKADDQWRTFVDRQPAKGILIGILLGLIYFGAVWLCYEIIPTVMVDRIGVSYRHAWVVTTILGLPLIVVFWLMFQSATDLPGDWKMINKGIGALRILILAFMAWWYYVVPNQFFDHQTGKAIFWVTEDGKAVWSGGYDPATGKKLRKGTVEDAKHLKQDPWPQEMVKAAEQYVPQIGIPKISMPSFSSPAKTKAPEVKVREQTYSIVPGYATEIALRPGVRNDIVYVGSARFMDRNGNTLYQGPASPSMMDGMVLARFWVESLDSAKQITLVTPG